jgi:hypothetical protein
MKDGSFGIVRENGVSLAVIKNFDLVFSQAARGTEMEVSRVLVSESDIFDLSPLPPVSSSLIIFLAKVFFSKEAEPSFQGREVAELFEPIKKGDNSAELDKIKRRQFSISGPRSSHGANTLKLKAKAANQGEMVMSRANAEPVSRDNRREGGVGKPGIF